MSNSLKENKKQLEVVAAILCFDGRYLALQRGYSPRDYVSYKWEFAGGKIEAGESQQAALIRELHEELALSVTELEHFLTITHNYPDFAITLHCFIVPLASREVSLNEHIDKRWLAADELMTVDWAEADLPAVEKLMAQHLG